MEEKNFKLFLDCVAEVMAREEFAAQKESTELQEAWQECEKCRERLQNALPKENWKLITDFDGAKNREGSVETNIAIVTAMRFLIRFLKSLELI